MVRILTMRYLKSIGAVAAGFLTVVLLSIGTDYVLEVTGVFPPQSEGVYMPWMLIVALAYRTLYTILGGFITAWLAPHSTMKHVWTLASFGLIGGIAGVIGGWNLSEHWYPIALAILAVPSVWFGGLLYYRRTQTDAA